MTDVRATFDKEKVIKSMWKSVHGLLQILEATSTAITSSTASTAWSEVDHLQTQIQNIVPLDIGRFYCCKGNEGSLLFFRLDDIVKGQFGQALHDAVISVIACKYAKDRQVFNYSTKVTDVMTYPISELRVYCTNEIFISEEDLPTYMGYDFTGKLLTIMMKG